MKLDEFILADELCTHYHVERHFVHALHESGLIHIETIERKEYVPVDKIPEFERMRRLHYEMDINIEGLEAINTLLEKISELQQEKQRLLNRLRVFE